MQLENVSRRKWLYYELKYYARTNFSRLNESKTFVSKYLGRNILSIKSTNELLYKKIMENKPFWGGRIGGNEMSMIAHFIRHQLFPIRTDAREQVLHNLYFEAGFFPEDLDKGEQFVDLMLDCVRDIDLIGVWNRYMEEWLLAEFAPDVCISHISYLQPWMVADLEENVKPWTAALMGKKVLVIHPFAASIMNQYTKNRAKIFCNLPMEDVLPDFELKTIKAVQTIGNNTSGFQDWFAALDDMVNECRMIDFDVAIIGCGAYGFPLAAEIKRMGKIAIHLGGVTQLLFGVRGNRWDGYGGVFKKMMNEHWVRPSENERIKDANKVENACYW